jgi:hypothetical protein
MSSWEEIFTSSNPAGGRMINVISGAAGSDASPYTANNPAGGRAINVNLVGGGGTVGTGFLQITGGVLDTTLRNVTDNSATPVVSPLQLSTTQVAMLGDTFFGASSATTNILTLQSTTRNQIKVTNGSTFEIWRSAGVESARFDSNGNFALGTTTASARLHVRGDGTNPIALYQNGAGTTLYSVNNVGVHFISYDGGQSALLGGGGTGIWYLGTSAYNYGSFPQFLTGSAAGFKFGDNITYNDGNSFVWINRLFNNQLDGYAQNQSYKFQNITYTINNPLTSSGTATGIFLNATETALNGMTHNLINLMVDNSSKARISNVGTLNLSGNIFANGYIEIGAAAAYYFSGRSYITSPSDGTLALFSNSGSTFGRLQFGGTTNAFPAIKRNGAAIDFRFADDSTFCNIRAGRLDLTGALLTGFINDATNAVTAITIANTSGNLLFNTPSLFAASGTINASARLQVDSTTQGFLPPRGTNTEMLAIPSPATGLVFYDTTNNKLNCYDGTTWQPCW